MAKRKKNRLRAATPTQRLQLVKHLRTAKPYFVVSATQLGLRLWLNRDDKLSRGVAAARRFATLKLATDQVDVVVDKYPNLRRQRFAIHKGY